MYGCVTFEWRQVAGGWTTLGGEILRTTYFWKRSDNVALPHRVGSRAGITGGVDPDPRRVAGSATFSSIR